jgi:hypothetical protein
MLLQLPRWCDTGLAHGRGLWVEPQLISSADSSTAVIAGGSSDALVAVSVEANESQPDLDFRRHVWAEHLIAFQDSKPRSASAASLRKHLLQQDLGEVGLSFGLSFGMHLIILFT